MPATGAGWKPVELSGLEGSTPSPSAEYGVRGVAVTAQAGPADMEPALRGARCPRRELVEVRQRGVLERHAEEVDDNHGSRLIGREPYTGVLLGEQAASKPAARGSTPRTRAYADVAEQLGTGFVNRLMLVQIQSSALASRWCNGQHKTLLRSWSWFDSRPGY